MRKKLLSVSLLIGLVFSLFVNVVPTKGMYEERMSRAEIRDLLTVYKALYDGNVSEWDFTKANDIVVTEQEVSEVYNEIYCSNEVQAFSIDPSEGGGNTFSKYFDASKTKWVKRKEGITLSCYYKPSAIFASTGNATMVNVSKAFASLKSIFGSSSYWKNTKSMEAQFHCHAMTVGKLKNPWNIEPWRTESNIDKVIAKGCNP